MTINKIFVLLLFLAGFWFAGFWMGKSCYTASDVCYVPIVREVLNSP